MGTPATRRQYSRDGLRHETDLTAKEWRLIAAASVMLHIRRIAGTP